MNRKYKIVKYRRNILQVVAVNSAEIITHSYLYKLPCFCPGEQVTIIQSAKNLVYQLKTMILYPIVVANAFMLPCWPLQQPLPLQLLTCIKMTIVLVKF